MIKKFEIAVPGRRTFPAGLNALGLIGIICLLLEACASQGSYSPPPRSTPTPTATKPAYPKPYKVMGQWYQPLPDSRGYRQTGIASWYGKDFHGRKTSNGETYDMYGISAAHKTLPLGTVVSVRNLENNKEITLRINDRGPFVRGRIIDLSYGAAQKLGVVGPGTATVEVIALAAVESSAAGSQLKPVDLTTGNFTFQVGAFKNRENARRLRAKLDQKYINAHIVAHDDRGETFYRVRVGRCTTLDKAMEYEKILMENGFPDVITVAE